MDRDAPNLDITIEYGYGSEEWMGYVYFPGFEIAGVELGPTSTRRELISEVIKFLEQENADDQ